MALLKPEIQKAVRAVVQEAFPETKKESEQSTITEALDASGLTTERIAEELTQIASNSGNEGMRLRALETALKVRGALKDTPSIIPSFTINIQPFSQASSTQPQQSIFFPRPASTVDTTIQDPSKVN